MLGGRAELVERRLVARRALHGPDVALSPVSAIGQHFRGHEVRRALDGGGLLRLVEGRQLRAGTKVRQLHGAQVVHQDVAALDVPVDDAVAVQVLQAVQDLPRVVADHT